MRILIVCPYFFPENVIAAHRVSAFANDWSESGHEITVLTRSPLEIDESLGVSKDVKVLRIKDPLAHLAARFSTLQGSVSPEGGSAALRESFRRLIKTVLFPDSSVLWALRATLRGLRIRQRQDAVLVSLGPLSGAIAAKTIAALHNAPLVADFRDLLFEYGKDFEPNNPPRPTPSQLLERYLLKKAKLLSSATKSIATVNEKKYGIRSVTVLNGVNDSVDLEIPHKPKKGPLRIVYAGTLFPAVRDPGPLFEALRRMKDSGLLRREITVDFYGRGSSFARLLAVNYGLEDCVFAHALVKPAQAFSLQRDADVLLLLYWNHPSELFALSGKIFEYLATRRPIIALGLTQGEGPRLINRLDAGICSTDPDEIQEFLLKSVREKREFGQVSSTSRVRPRSLRRSIQSHKLLAEISNLVSTGQLGMEPRFQSRHNILRGIASPKGRFWRP